MRVYVQRSVCVFDACKMCVYARMHVRACMYERDILNTNENILGMPLGECGEYVHEGWKESQVQ